MILSGFLRRKIPFLSAADDEVRFHGTAKFLDDTGRLS